MAAAKRLKTAGAVAAELTGGRQQIRPSMKARAAAGIESDTDEAQSESENTAKIGNKRKKSIPAKARTSAPKAQPKKSTKKTDSDDELGEEEEAHNTEEEDQVDAYECLQKERETDRPVSHQAIPVHAVI